MSRLRAPGGVHLLVALLLSAAAGGSTEATLKRAQIHPPASLGAFADGAWFLDLDADAQFAPASEILGWGSAGNLPLVCDWNGDGYDELGVFSGGVWFLDLNGDRSFDPATEVKHWGEPGWTPAPGDWNGDGIVDLGAVAPDSTWFRDLNGDFQFDPATEILGWGTPGSTPVAGDWNGDGKDEVGVFSGGAWFLDLDGNSAFNPATEIVGWGVAGWTPAPGDWNGDGKLDLGVVAPDFTWFRDVDGNRLFDPATEIIGWGVPGSTPVVADWNGDGRDSVGVFAGGAWFLDSNGDEQFDPATEIAYWGFPGARPVQGGWAVGPASGIQIDPPNGSANLPTNRRIILSLPRPVDPASVNAQTVQVLRGGAPAMVTYRVSHDGRFVMIGGALNSPNATVEITVQGLLDTTGAPLGDGFQATLTSGPESSFQQLTSVNWFVKPVPTNTVLHQVFHNPIDPTSFDPANSKLVRRFDSKEVPVACSLSDDWKAITCIPGALLDVGTEYSLGWGDLDNLWSDQRTNSGVTFSTSFMEDGTPPAVIGSFPMNGAVDHGIHNGISVFFDEPVTLGPASRVELRKQGGVAVPVWASQDTYSRDAIVITPATGPFAPSIPLEPNAAYVLTVAGIVNLAGLPMAGQFQVTFSTVEFASNQNDVWFSPSYGAVDVPLDAKVVMGLRDPVIAATVNSNTFLLRGPGGQVPAQLRIESGGRRVVLDPLVNLASDTDYVVEITPGLVYPGSNGATRQTIGFHTGDSQDAGPPFVVAVNPLPGAVNQVLRTRVTIRLSEEIEPQQVRPSTVSLIAEGPIQPEYQMRLLDSSLIEVEPSYHAPLQANTTYRVRLDGISDRAGKPLPPYETTFRTAAGVDNTPPALVSSTPILGATGVALDEVVDLSISEPLNPLTVAAGSTYLFDMDRGVASPTAVTLAASAQQIRLVPLQPLSPMTRYTVITLAADSSGNRFYIQNWPLFTTGPGPADNTSPSVVDVSIAEGELVQLDGEYLRFDVTFSEPVERDTLHPYGVFVLANGRDLSAFPHMVSSDNRVFSYQIHEVSMYPHLSAGQSPDIQIEILATDAVEDFAGNSLSPSFSRRFGVNLRSSLPPAIRLHEARPAGTEVSPNTPVTVVLTEAFVTSDVSQTLYVSENGRLVPGTITALHGNTVLRFTPAQPWQPGAIVQVFIREGIYGAVSGTALAPPSTGHRFEVAGAAPGEALTVLAFTTGPQYCCSPRPLNLRWLARLSAPVDPATITTDSVRLTDYNGTIVPTTVRLIGGTLVEAIPTVPLGHNQIYRLELTSAIHTAGGQALQAVQGPQIAVSDPPDSAAPATLAVSPPSGFAGAPLNSLIRVRLSEAPHNVLVDTSLLTLQCGGAPQRIGSVFVPAVEGATVIEWRPEQLLPAGSSCTAMVAGLEDRAGNPVPAATWTFTTGSAVDTVAPKAGTPAPQGQAVSTNAVIAVPYSEAIDPTSIDPTSIMLRENSAYTAVDGAFSFTDNGKTFVFTPAGPLAVGTDYTLAHNPSLQDLAGNFVSFAGPSFRTGFGVDTTPPSVSQINLIAGATVSAFFRFDVTLSELVHPQSVNSATVRILDGASPLPLYMQLDSDFKTLHFNGLTSLPLGKTLTVQIAGLTDMAGNTMSVPFTLTFATLPTLDFKPPTGDTNIRDARGVYRNVSAKLRFSEPIDPATVRPDTIYFEGLNGPLPSQPILDPGGMTGELRPSGPLPAGAFVRVVVSPLVTDLSRNGFTYPYSPFAGFRTGSALTDVDPPVFEWPAILLAPQLPTNFPWGLLPSIVSESLDPWSYSGDLVEMRDSGGAVVKPWTMLLPNATYTLSVQPALDLAGNALTPPAPLTFTTGPAQDTTPPSVVGHVPASEATGVPVDAPITVTFSEPVWFGYLFLFEGLSVETPFVRSMSADGRTLTLTPVGGLLPNTRYTVSFAAYDVGNNELDCCRFYGFGFTTGGPLVPDAEPPVLLSINPPDGATGVSDPRVTLTYSERLDAASVRTSVALFVDGQLATDASWGSGSITTDGATIQLQPINSMPPSAEITVVVAEGLTDLAGNAAAPFVSRFDFVNPFTAPPERPYVQAVRPPAGATEVAVDASIYVFFSQPVDATSVPAAIIVSENGAVKAGAVTMSSGDQVARFTPAAPFLADAWIKLFVDLAAVKTPAGESIGSFYHESAFRTEGAPLPATVEAVSGIGSLSRVPRNSHVTVRFDRPMDPATFGVDSVRFNSLTPLTYSLEDGDRVLRVVPTDLLPADRQITLLIGNEVRALDGASLPSNFRIQFLTSADILSTPTELTALSPADGATGVGVNAALSLVFSNLIDPLSVNEGTVRWTDGSGNGVPSMIEISRIDAQTLVKVTPHDPFAPLETYTVTVEGVEDIAGQVVPPMTATFTAGEAPDFVHPWQTDFAPGPSNAPRNAVMRIEFGEPLSPTTVNSSSVVLEQRVDPTFQWTPVPAAVALSANGRTILVTPQSLLDPNTTYRARVSLVVRDDSGNWALSADNVFTTGVDIDTTPPQFVLVGPANGATGVPTNTSLVFEFDSAIRPGSAIGVRLESGGVPVPLTRTVDGVFLELKPTTLLDPLTTYTWTLQGLEDLAGNPMPGTITGTFSTGPTAQLGPLNFAATSPAQGATGVSRNSSIVLQFASPLNPRTIDPMSYVQEFISLNSLPVNVIYSQDLKQITLQPLDPLPPQAGIQVQAPFGLRDLTGRGPVSNNSFTFNTGP